MAKLPDISRLVGRQLEREAQESRALLEAFRAKNLRKVKQ